MTCCAEVRSRDGKARQLLGANARATAAREVVRLERTTKPRKSEAACIPPFRGLTSAQQKKATARNVVCKYA
jgi:hypothetical protein